MFSLMSGTGLFYLLISAYTGVQEQIKDRTSSGDAKPWAWHRWDRPLRSLLSGKQDRNELSLAGEEEILPIPSQPYRNVGPNVAR